jgi:hypothetical protein
MSGSLFQELSDAPWTMQGIPAITAAKNARTNILFERFIALLLFVFEGANTLITYVTLYT